MLADRDAADRSAAARTMAVSHHVGFRAGRQHAKAEADQLAIPDEILGRAGLGRVDRAFREPLCHLHPQRFGTTLEPRKWNRVEPPGTMVSRKGLINKDF